MNRALFLDRDGVINVDRGYVSRPEDFEFVEGIFETCRRYQAQGYLLIVVTNQSGIARGLYSEQDFARLTDWMCERFREQGVTLTAVYHCPHHPDFGDPKTRHCGCRKPAPGMLFRAIAEHHIDPARSIMIGDQPADMAAAAAAGIGERRLVAAAGDPVPR